MMSITFDHFNLYLNIMLYLVMGVLRGMGGGGGSVGRIVLSLVMVPNLVALATLVPGQRRLGGRGL